MSENEDREDDIPTSGKGEVEHKLEAFIDRCFEECKLPGEETCEEISEVRCGQLLYQLMEGHHYGEAWDDEEFKHLYNQYQDDEGHSH
eukprot:CAMPEP_0170494690 /NCGR_PEP_ID=MMETSP0208-20121228/14784_1 /TAXON_ID=197538 /ORGANISM="Strombidium inclinatum, Strain S3" /LENGTH=87 /DNA_ID=CAMNT_0010770777 /DNA_START=11 /DNA_END=271 /DNA_ORIENTATION=+